AREEVRVAEVVPRLEPTQRVPGGPGPLGARVQVGPRGVEATELEQERAAVEQDPACVDWLGRFEGPGRLVECRKGPAGVARAHAHETRLPAHRDLEGARPRTRGPPGGLGEAGLGARDIPRELELAHREAEQSTG